MDVNSRRNKKVPVTPRKPKDNLMKFIDGSEPGDLSHVMLAVDQNEHVWYGSSTQ